MRAIIVLFVLAACCASAVAAPFVTSPIIVASHDAMTAGQLFQTQTDAPVSTYTVLGNRYWLSSQWDRGNGKITHSVHGGNLDTPYSQTLWTKDTCARSSQGYCMSSQGYAFAHVVPSDVVDLWFVNLYQPQPVDDGELLAFVHEERAGMTGGTPQNREGRTRIGLAWSNDHGNTWTYLGRIIAPYGDPDGHNVQGAPYVIKDGYFHVYFTDKVTTANGVHDGIAVARASVASVLQAARSGSLGTGLWKKHSNGTFATDGLGGASSPIAPWGITHTQAAYSTHTGKYYLPLTFMTWPSGSGGRVNSSVKIYESTDAVTWAASPSIVVADEAASTLRNDAGYQYCSIVDRGGAPNAQVGADFYVYCVKDPYLYSANFGLYRWQVMTSPAAGDVFRQSKDFGTAQGPRWQYLHGDGNGPLQAMTWSSAGYWVGTDAYARVVSDGFHTGATQMPVLAWLAPNTGTVRIEGTARSANPMLGTDGLPNCGDGFSVGVTHDSTALGSVSIVAADTVGASFSMSRPVVAGDALFFIAAPGANNYCDSVRFDPSIRYE